MTALSFADACKDPALFGPWFSGDTWGAWSTIDKAIFGGELSDAEFVQYAGLTGRLTPPTTPASEVWIIAGRRGGKSAKTAALATYLATIGAELFGYRQHLSRGERGVVQIVAVDRKQATILLQYVKAYLEQPLLNQLVKRETREGVDLKNSISIEVATNDRRSIRGRTLIGAVFEEVAHWYSENTANPDIEVYNAVKPATATMPGALIVGISSPYARRGLLWERYKAHFGREDSDVLVIQAPTRLLNPTVPAAIVEAAMADDPQYAQAEYLAQFRSDVDTLVPATVVDAATATGCFERPPVPGIRYYGFIDAAGGSGRDSMTLAVAHVDQSAVVLDALREVRPPFSPNAVVEDFCKCLKTYNIKTVKADKWGSGFVMEAFAEHDIICRQSAAAKSDIYLELLPTLNSGRVELLDNARLRSQLVGLERKTARGGRDSIDHPPGAHDDLANAAAGALVEALQKSRREPLVAMEGRYGMFE